MSSLLLPVLSDAVVVVVIVVVGVCVVVSGDGVGVGVGVGVDINIGINGGVAPLACCSQTLLLPTFEGG